MSISGHLLSCVSAPYLLHDVGMMKHYDLTILLPHIPTTTSYAFVFAQPLIGLVICVTIATTIFITSFCIAIYQSLFVSKLTLVI